MSYYRVKDLPENLRPRERLEKGGPSSLSDAELLAIILRTGGRGKSVISLAEEMLKEAGSLAALSSFSFERISSIKNVGKAKAAQVVAAFELGRRAAFTPIDGTKIRNPLDVVEFLKGFYGNLKDEVFGAVYMNQANRILKTEILHVGGRKSSLVDVGKLMRRALELSATRLIVFHNHPSGDPFPSRDDIRITDKIKEASSILDIELLDHIIIGGNKFYSFAEGGRDGEN